MYQFESVYNKRKPLQTIGRHMRLTYLLIFFSLSALAQNKPRIQVIPNPESLEDFEHEFKGCPENSECDQVMGHMLKRWKTLVSNLRESTDYAKNAQAIEMFRGKYGIPVEFYTNQKSQISFKPALNSSSCKEHNPKPPGVKIFRGISFMKSMTMDTAMIWRDQALIELPIKDNLILQPVKVYYSTGAITYNLPIDDQPLFIKGKELYVLKEEDGFYYVLKISENGDWKIVSVDFTQLSVWENKRQNVACPTEKEKNPTVFNNEFCKTVWDEETKKVITVRMEQGCII